MISSNSPANRRQAIGKPFIPWLSNAHLCRTLASLALLFYLMTGALMANSSHLSSPRSPVNQVFQYATSDTTTWADGSITSANVYLWIPEQCLRLRGLLIMASNVPEHMLVGHSKIRDVCAANNLGIIWSVRSFWNFAKTVKGQEKNQVDFLQKCLDGLAKCSGYEEVSTVPWLPMGESGHLLMVVGLIDQKPERCMAGICIKNPQYPKNREVPLLMTLGTAQEWGQAKVDLRSSWNTPTQTYKVMCGTRQNSAWPLSVLIEPSTGHFYCSEPMVEYFAQYIDLVAKARLSNDGSPTLKSVDLSRGFLAHNPVPEFEGQTEILPYIKAEKGDLGRPWYFCELSAKHAQKITQTNWKAQIQIPTFSQPLNCDIKPFSFNSVTQISISTSGHFGLEGALLSSIPENFIGAGTTLSPSAEKAVVEWICGPVAPLGNGQFRLALDRTWKTGAACYMISRTPATPTHAFGVQPAMVQIKENTEGNPQTITFEKLPPLKKGLSSLPLRAKASSGLPVQFYVISGPAMVKDDQLIFTDIPPRSKYPVEVHVAAWQWGSPKDPQVQMAKTNFQKIWIENP